jgi:hypothetical protein
MTIIKRSALVLALAVCAWAVRSARGASVRPLLDAIRQVESGGNCNAVGDGGRSIGPYQIQRAYWQDSGVTGQYSRCREVGYSERVMLAYWKRYCPGGNYEALARTHNGGPSRRGTDGYWRQVKAQLRKGK